MSISLSGAVRIRSGCGLSFRDVILIDRDGIERRRDVHEGLLDSEGVPLPATLKAPGHRPEQIVEAGQELVLRPEALFSIDGRGLRACNAKIDLAPLDPTVLDDLAAFGFVSPERWCLALNAELLVQRSHRKALTIQVSTDELFTYELDWSYATSPSSSWEFPECSTSGFDGLRVRLAGLRDAEYVLRVQRPADESSPDAWSVPWGIVTRRNVMTQGPVLSRGGWIEWPELPIGLEYEITLLGNDGVLGEARVLHDGERKELRAACVARLSGDIAFPEGLADDELRISVSWFAESEPSSLQIEDGPRMSDRTWWGAASETVEPIGTKSVAYAGWKQIPWKHDEPPTRVSIVVTCPGCKRAVVSVPMSECTAEWGVIRLERE